VQRVLAALHSYPVDASEAGKELSYKLALPGLDSMAEVRSYIGHVARGIAMGIFTGREGSQLLYAAQVAMGTLRSETSPAQPERKKR
jgi:hypothetical protein